MDDKASPAPPRVVYAPDSNPEGRIGATEVMTTADLPSDSLVALALRRHKLKEMFPACNRKYKFITTFLCGYILIGKLIWLDACLINYV